MNLIVYKADGESLGNVAVNLPHFLKRCGIDTILTVEVNVREVYISLKELYSAKI